MYPIRILNPRAWAEQQFGKVDVGDERHSHRLVDVAARMMSAPNASLPMQMKSGKALKATYRFLHEEDVTNEAIMKPHWQQTRESASREKVVLMVEDTTELDYTHHPTTTGLAPIGDGRGRGFHLHTVLAIIPEPRQVLGIIHYEPFRRKPSTRKEGREQHYDKERESQVWPRAVDAVGEPPPDSLWVHVGDAASDNFEFLEACQRNHVHVAVRAAHDRRVETPSGEKSHLPAFSRSLPARGEKILKLPARRGEAARDAQLRVSFSPVKIIAPWHSRRKPALSMWVVRIWEVSAPQEVKEPLEWILLTSVPTNTVEEAWKIADWYSCRWLVEDYHKCLKSGCLIEKRHLQDGERLLRLLGIVAPIAVRLLQLREIARLMPKHMAIETLPRELVELVAMLAETSSKSLTVGDFWREVARQGGYLGRRHDGPPGWETLWKGWQHIQTLLAGVQLATRLPPKRCG